MNNQESIALRVASQSQTNDTAALHMRVRALELEVAQLVEVKFAKASAPKKKAAKKKANAASA